MIGLFVGARFIEPGGSDESDPYEDPLLLLGQGLSENPFGRAECPALCIVTNHLPQGPEFIPPRVLGVDNRC